MSNIEKVLEKQRAWQMMPDDDESRIRALAIESLSICADAIAVLKENLREIGYTWVFLERIPADELEENVQNIETTTGLSVPKILIEFWKTVGAVSFVDLETYHHIDFWEKQKIVAPKGFADGVHVDPCNSEWAAFICRDHKEWKNFNRQDESEKFLLSLSPDGFHKDNISGGAPYGVFAESSWKPVWQYFEWSGMIHPATATKKPLDFLSYLRTATLECAGFPALLGVNAFEPLREKLLEGVPIY